MSTQNNTAYHTNFLEVEPFKQALIDGGIYPAFVARTIEKQQFKGVRATGDADLILTFERDEPNKPYMCTSCLTRYKDYQGINFCSCCGSKINNVF